MIDSYRFGEIVIEGQRYTSDVLIFPQRVRAAWWRKEGHRLSIEDLSEALAEEPEMLVVGTGSYGFMEVPEETRHHIESHGIQLVAQDTEKACLTYNRLCPSQKVVAALHLTC